MELPGPKQEPEPYKPTLNPDDDYPPIGEPPAGYIRKKSPI
jgi:hypothetical protein